MQMHERGTIFCHSLYICPKCLHLYLVYLILIMTKQTKNNYGKQANIRVFDNATAKFPLRLFDGRVLTGDL